MDVTFETMPRAIARIESELLGLRREILTLKKGEAEDELLTIEQAGEFLNLAIQTLYAKVSKREIPYMKRGKRLYFSKTDLLKWLSKGKTEVAKEVDGGQFLATKKNGGSHE